MWVRDIEGRLVNTAHVASAGLTSMVATGDACEVRACEVGTCGDCWILFEGTQEECDRYLAGLDRLLGVVDPLSSPADALALTQDDCQILTALLSGMDIERLLTPDCIPQAVPLLERITDAAVGRREEETGRE